MLAFWAIAIGVGVYVLRAKGEELEQVERAEKVARLKKAELEQLFMTETQSREAARDATRRWFARYKIIPEELSSPEVVGYLNSLTAAGFKNFDVTATGTKEEPNISYHTFTVDGRGYFSSLYKFIWSIENNRNFYRIENLSLDHIDLVTEDKERGKPQLQVMVSFRMSLNAYFSGTEGVSAPEDLFAEMLEGQSLPIGWTGQLPPVPKDILPDESPAVNPFYPGIMEQIPPNTEGYVDIEDGETQLVSIVGGKAVFRDGQGYRQLGVGDPVYLGQITDIDPVEGRVSARLNKGGIIDNIDLSLDVQQGYRQAIGGTRLAPTGNR
jgi:hypothetical protein